jgi:hypothetical protein
LKQYIFNKYIFQCVRENCEFAFVGKLKVKSVRHVFPMLTTRLVEKTRVVSIKHILLIKYINYWVSTIIRYEIDTKTTWNRQSMNFCEKFYPVTTHHLCWADHEVLSRQHKTLHFVDKKKIDMYLTRKRSEIDNLWTFVKSFIPWCSHDASQRWRPSAGKKKDVEIIYESLAKYSTIKSYLVSWTYGNERLQFWEDSHEWQDTSSIAKSMPLGSMRSRIPFNGENMDANSD